MKTIQELCVKLSETTMSAEQKKGIAMALPLLFNKTELLDGLAWCYGSIENEILESNNSDSYHPSQSSYYDIINILLFLLNMKTFKESDDWEEIYRAIVTRLFY